jgi:predicted nuclease of predicted toxin-antitoxin system
MAWKPLEVSEAEVRAHSKSATKKARFLLDESVDPIVAKVLSDRGLNVVTASELRLEGHCDEDQLAAAKRDDRILLTHDADFLNDRRFPLDRNPGVVVLPGGSGTTDELAGAIQILFTLIAPLRELWREKKIRISAGGYITVRRRNRDSGRYEETRYRMTKNGPALIWVDDDGN